MDAKIAWVQIRVMRAFLVVAAFAVAACQTGTPPAPAVGLYTRDIGRLCDVVQLAGVTDKHGDERTLLVAMWLGKNLETPEAHDFLVRIQPLEGAAKATALDDEARRVGYAHCALADEWR
jgi:hypothetical protein